MSDKPIPFKAPMVRAILREIEKPGTGKTQTRRVLECGDLDRPFQMDDGSWHVTDSQGGHMSPLRVRYSVGDLLWVRETWRGEAVYDDTPPRDIPHDACQVRYEADGKWSDRDAMTRAGKLRPSMFMPRWASRLTLTVTAVKVERLQDISVGDAIREGIEPGPHSFGWRCYLPEPKSQDYWASPRESFRTLWTSIHGPDAWAANPWVVAYTFTPALANIDETERSAA